jgi:hypothetical protein
MKPTADFDGKEAVKWTRVVECRGDGGVAILGLALKIHGGERAVDGSEFDRPSPVMASVACRGSAQWV